MSKKQEAQNSHKQPRGPERDSDQNSDNDNAEADRPAQEYNDESESRPWLPNNFPAPQVELQPPPPPPFVPNTGGPVPLTVWQGAQYVGHIMLNSMIDLSNIYLPPNAFLEISLDKAKLIITQPYTTLPAVQGAPTSQKRKASQETPFECKKRPKRVARGARPVATKPASAYARAVEMPKGMTKNEEDSCLTCIKHNRKCGGTQLHMVKGHKRCQNCAFPGKGCCGRICYWPNKERNIATYEDGVRVMGKELGGRTLAKNTRKGRLERQKRGESQIARAESPIDEDFETEEEPDGEGESCFGEEESGKEDHEQSPNAPRQEERNVSNYPDNNFVDPDLLSAVASAHQSLYEIIARDMGLPDNATHSTMMELAVERVIRDALQGWGSHQDYLEGIPDEVLRVMITMVSMTIADRERKLGG